MVELRPCPYTATYNTQGNQLSYRYTGDFDNDGVVDYSDEQVSTYDAKATNSLFTRP